MALGYRRNRTPDALGLDTPGLTAPEQVLSIDADVDYVGMVEVTPTTGDAYKVAKLGEVYLWIDGTALMVAKTLPDARAGTQAGAIALADVS